MTSHPRWSLPPEGAPAADWRSQLRAGGSEACGAFVEDKGDAELP